MKYGYYGEESYVGAEAAGYVDGRSSDARPITEHSIHEIKRDRAQVDKETNKFSM